MTFAIVDDSTDDREALKKQLLPYLTQNHFSAEITEFENAEEFLLAASQKTFSVVFLDIYMKEKTGMDVAQELFNSGCNSKLIFLSSSTDFFRQSYAVHAVYYLVKPIVPEEFRLAMQFLKLRPEYDVPFLEIVHNNVSRTIPTEQILYLEVQNHTTTIYTLEETIHLSVPFRELAEKLEQDERFLRCIRGILVNMQHIRGMGKNVFYLPNDIQVPVNIRHQKQIGDTWRAYLYSHMED